MCRLFEELKDIDKMMNKCSDFDEWYEISLEADEICLKISECNIKCGNNACKGLQRNSHYDEELIYYEMPCEFFEERNI